MHLNLERLTVLTSLFFVKVSVQTSLYKGHKFESNQEVPKVLSKVLVLTLPKVRTS